ncbi:hypothetical protein ACRC6Q_16730 [Planococcus sp. SE5232]|uniref:hypothetical protein n=1 Tax=unclassified Planococcus (in: firmicutes) TaxID=2662419 RepID=UPI003D6BA4CD
MAKLSRPKQNEMIEIEIRKWNKVFSKLSEEKKEAASDLIRRVAFMTITLGILEEDIKIKGPTYKMKNGQQEMFVENPSQKSYNTMINRYTVACDRLISLLPKDAGDPPKRDASGLT